MNTQIAEKQIITAAEASAILKANGFDMSPVWLRYAIEQGQYSFGATVFFKKGKRCKIYRRKLLEWIRENSEECI